MSRGLSPGHGPARQAGVCGAQWCGGFGGLTSAFWIVIVGVKPVCVQFFASVVVVPSRFTRLPAGSAAAFAWCRLAFAFVSEYALCMPLSAFPAWFASLTKTVSVPL